MSAQNVPSSKQSGVSLTEALIVVVMIAAAMVPVSNALRGSLDAVEADTAVTVNHYRLLGKLEEVLAQPLSNLSGQALGPSVATSFSDAPATTDRRLVFVSAYDGDDADADNDPFTGTDSGLLWVRVEIEGTVMALEALKSD